MKIRTSLILTTPLLDVLLDKRTSTDMSSDSQSLMKILYLNTSFLLVAQTELGA